MHACIGCMQAGEQTDVRGHDNSSIAGVALGTETQPGRIGAR